MPPVYWLCNLLLHLQQKVAWHLMATSGGMGLKHLIDHGTAFIAHRFRSDLPQFLADNRFLGSAVRNWSENSGVIFFRLLPGPSSSERFI
jgi:hypothetical protein